MACKMDMSRILQRMDMNHSKMEGMEKDDIKKQMDMSEGSKRRNWKWIILRWKG
jgi:hypothetical protein